MKIEICSDGKIKKDDVELVVADINSELLESMMDLGLKNELDFVDNSTADLVGNPIVELFKSLNETTKADSDFRKQITEIESKKAEIDKKLEENNDDDSDIDDSEAGVLEPESSEET